MKMRKRVTNILGGFLAAAALVGVEGSWTPSGAAPGWAYLWANYPSLVTEYTPNPAYQYNSVAGGGLGSPTANTVKRTGVGAYTASLPGLGEAKGTVHVTAYGWKNESCMVYSWFPVGSVQKVNVRCYNEAGSPADTYFTMSYAHPSSSFEEMAFLWADQPAARLGTEYVPNRLYQFNSSGATNTVVRDGVGQYTAKVPGLRAIPPGHVQVTAYGAAGGTRCKVVDLSVADLPGSGGR